MSKIAYGPRKMLLYTTRADICAGKHDLANEKRTLEEAIAFGEGIPESAASHAFDRCAPQAAREAHGDPRDTGRLALDQSLGNQSSVRLLGSQRLTLGGNSTATPSPRTS